MKPDNTIFLSDRELQAAITGLRMAVGTYASAFGADCVADMLEALLSLIAQQPQETAYTHKPIFSKEEKANETPKS